MAFLDLANIKPLKSRCDTHKNVSLLAFNEESNGLLGSLFADYVKCPGENLCDFNISDVQKHVSLEPRSNLSVLKMKHSERAFTEVLFWPTA